MHCSPALFLFFLLLYCYHHRGEGDLHDPTFEDFVQEVVLSDPGQYSNSTPTYMLSCYPNDVLFTVYKTNNPITATIGSICIMIFTSLLFFLYDFMVRNEFHHKESLSKARRQFVRYISHEVRTPLNAVCMGLQLLQDKTKQIHKKSFEDEDNKDHEELQKQLAEIADLEGDILNNAHSAVNVLNDVLQYDKVESGTLKLELTLINIFELIEQTSSEFRQSAKLKELEYSLIYETVLPNGERKQIDGVDCAMNLPQFFKERRAIGDASRLKQVLRNLISNALKFTPKTGKLTIRVILDKQDSLENTKTTEKTLHSGETAMYEHGGSLRIEVTDTGAGMTPVQLSNLFKEGVQFNVNKLQAGQGSGLGLYIAKGILVQHDGSLEASSEGVGCGSTMTMTLPLYYIDDPDLLNQEESRRPVQTDMLKPLNILVVDDSNVNRKLLARLLRLHNHTCVEAENGRIALEKVLESTEQGEPYDLILMDYEMPEMDGCIASKNLREMGCDSFIVGVTGALFNEDVVRFKQCGANEVLAKPLDMNILMEMLVENGVAAEEGGSRDMVLYDKIEPMPSPFDNSEPSQCKFFCLFCFETLASLEFLGWFPFALFVFLTVYLYWILLLYLVGAAVRIETLSNGSAEKKDNDVVEV